MAKNVGLIQFNGALGDLVSYERNGVQVVQRKGGFNSERIKTEERYASVRKRQSEFGKCAKLSSAIKRGLDHWLPWTPNAMIYNYIQSVVMGVKNCDLDSEKGAKTFEKGLQTAAGANLLRNMELNRKRKLNAGMRVTQPFDFATGTVQVVPYNYKLKNKVKLGVTLVVLQVDLATYDYTVLDTGLQLCERLDAVLDLQIAVPEKSGLMAAFLFANLCDCTSNTLFFKRDVQMGFGILDFKVVP
ncbi:hypothetical protein OX283_014740 [Flavobacterium sp. SUN052]|uniref:hypothetical protein n=1 Tax=Flavobacterium sp. SUN052 TaxID=3002441 RepID=UPI00237D7EB3|nr:hypothetical protein [Flavobacterium sp. SUN052]MEC4005924.1 hypothetical protein [Flavobacterium sp. SUN052]